MLNAKEIENDARDGFWPAWRADLEKRRNQTEEEQRKEALYYEAMGSNDYNEHKHREDLVILAALRVSAIHAAENGEQHLFEELTRMIAVKLLRFKNSEELEEQSGELQRIIHPS